MTWAPSSTILEDWGRLRLVVGGTDVTFYRDVPAQVISWSQAEPFGDLAMVVGFPQITTFEALPSWLYDYANADLELVRPNGTRKVLFEGMFVSEDDRLTQTESSLEVTFIGALYQTDFFRKIPEMFRWGNAEDDIMLLIQREFDLAARPSLRTNALKVPGWCGVTYDQIGAWQPSLTGYVQELLSVGTSSGMPLPGEPIVGIEGKPGGGGYWLVGSEGSVLPFGDARFFGSMVGTRLTEPASGITAHPTEGYWFGARDGGVFSFGYDIQFHGSLGATGNPTDIRGIDAMADGNGYRLVDEAGGVFCFGSATYHGSIPEAGVPDLVAGDKIVSISGTGSGYLLFSEKGYVYAFGNALYFGGADGDGKKYVAGIGRPQNDGYWLLASDGTIRKYGVLTPAFAAIVPSPAASAMAVTASGAGLWVADESGGVFALGDATFHGSVPGGGGTDSQWTVMKEEGRRPILKVKNVWEVSWTITLGTPGIEHTLSRDLTMAPNVYFGEGTDPEGCTWRNSKYPGTQPEIVPVFSGVTLEVGSTHADVRKFEQQMFDSGWTDFSVDGTFSPRDSNLTRAFQVQAGLNQTGTVNAQTWAAAFQVGSLAGDLKAAFIAPLVADNAVTRNLRNAKGDIIGSNPDFDRNRVRLETYDNYGSRTTKWEGTTSASARLQRDFPASYSGQINLGIDPREGSRFEIQAGQNINVRAHRGATRQFHIANVDVQWDSGTVTLEVDTGNRDMLTLAAFRSRHRESSDVSGRPQRHYRNSRNTEDRQVVWDCESGAGIIPRHAIGATTWNVLRIPCGELGRIVSTEFLVETPARFSVGVFDRAITPATLASLGSPDAPDYWDDWWDDQVTWTDRGLIMAYGSGDEMGGFYPGQESNDDPLTGKLRDDTSWHFHSITPPWLWVAMWCESPQVNYISGRLKPGIFQ